MLTHKRRRFLSTVLVLSFVLNAAVSYGSCGMLENLAQSSEVSNCHEIDSTSMEGNKCCVDCVAISIPTYELDSASNLFEDNPNSYEVLSPLTGNLSPPFRPPISYLS